MSVRLVREKKRRIERPFVFAVNVIDDFEVASKWYGYCFTTVYGRFDSPGAARVKSLKYQDVCTENKVKGHADKLMRNQVKSMKAKVKLYFETISVSRRLLSQIETRRLLKYTSLLKYTHTHTHTHTYIHISSMPSKRNPSRRKFLFRPGQQTRDFASFSRL